jgi:hypothetical protein
MLMKKLLLEFFSKILSDDKNRFPAIIIDPNYVGGDVGSYSYFHSDEARKAAISAGTHKLPPEEMTGFAPEVPAGWEDMGWEDMLGIPPEDAGAQEPSPSDISSAPFVPTPLPEPSREELERETPTQLDNSELSLMLQAIDDEISQLSDGKMQPIVEGYADRDIPEANSDEVFYNTYPSVLSTRFVVPSELRQQLRAGNVPEKYIKFLERVLNSRSKVKPSEMSSAIGQGSSASLFGEAFTMTLLALPAESRRILIDLVSAAVEEGKKKIAPDISWVESSVGHAAAFQYSMDLKYGQGNWAVDGVAWDVAEDIEGLGLARQDKGKSTDIIIRVKLSDGRAFAQRESLKKDENTDFLSLSLNTLRKTLLRYHPDPENGKRALRLFDLLEELKKDKLSPEQIEERNRKREALRRSVQREGETMPPSWVETVDRASAAIEAEERVAIANAPPKLIETFRLLTSLSVDQARANAEVLHTLVGNLPRTQLNQIRQKATPAQKIALKCVASSADPKQILDCLKNTPLSVAKRGNPTEYILPSEYSATLLEASQLIADHHQANRKHAVYAAATDLIEKKVFALSDKICNLYIESLLDTNHPETVRSLVDTMASNFSIRSALQDKQEVLVDGFVMNQQVLQKVFGIDASAELEEQLRIVTVDGEKVLAYQVKGSTRFIVIGTLRVRQKVRGKSGLLMLSIECSREFATSCAENGLAIAHENTGTPSIGFSRNPNTGRPAEKIGHVWMQVGDKWIQVANPLNPRNQPKEQPREGYVWAAIPVIKGNSASGEVVWKEIENTPQLQAVARMRSATVIARTRAAAAAATTARTRAAPAPAAPAAPARRRITATSATPPTRRRTLSESMLLQKNNNPLLLEFYKKIMFDEAYSDKKKQELGIPLDAVSKGRGWYRGDVYIGRVIDKKFVAATDKSVHRSGRRLARRRKRSAVEQMKTLATVFRAKLRRLRHPEKKEALQALISALESGDTAKIQEVIDNYKFTISSTGKLKARSIKADDRALFVPTQTENVPELLAAILEAAGVEMPRQPTVARQHFKASTLLPAGKKIISEVTTENGKITVSYIDTSNKTRRVLQKLEQYSTDSASIDARVAQWVSQNEDRIKHLDGARREEFLRDLRKVTADKIAAHNELVEELSKLPPKQRSARILAPETGFDEIISSVEKTIQALGVTDAGEVIQKMNELKTASQEDSARLVQELIQEIDSSSLETARPYLLEIITAMLVLRNGDTVLLPQSEQFPLADVIGVGESGVLGGPEVYALFVDYQVETSDQEAAELSGFISVKSGAGAASSNRDKISRTRFRYPIQGSPDPENTGNRRQPRRDLTQLYELHSSTSLFAVPTSTETLDTHQSTIKEQLRRYEAEIRNYFGFSAATSLDEIFDMLSSGTSLECGENGTAAPSRQQSTLLSKADDGLNQRQWQLSFVAGMVTEAIYNATTESQSYVSHMFSQKGELTIADGRRILTGMKFEPYKAITTRNGFVVPNQGQVAHTVPIAAADLPTAGNPCNNRR